MQTQILRIDCNDEKGLVHKVTGILYKHSANIIGNAEFVDENRFFMRTEFVKVGQNNITSELKKVLPKGANIRLTDNKKKKIVVLATKEHHCLAEILVKNAYKELHADLLAVISNHTILKELVERWGIPFHFITHEKKSRKEHEKEIRNCINKYAPDYVILAKYMRVLTPEFISAYKDRILNIHHSFLPAFVGKEPYKQAFDRGVKIIGATAHFVTDKLDEGPIIAQDIISVDHSYSVDAMKKAGQDVEKIVLTKAMQLVFNEKVFINNNKTIIFG